MAHDVLKQFNNHTDLCRTADGTLYIAKREPIHDLVIVKDRLHLVDSLVAASFPCPRYVEIQGDRFVVEGDYVTLFQEFVDTTDVDQGHWYSREKLRDAGRLLIRFQDIVRNQENTRLAEKFRLYLEQKFDERRTQYESRKDTTLLELLDWLEQSLPAIDALAKIPCHASFRHHNLVYDRARRLHVIDFFHDQYYAPRIYDLCVLIGNCSYGVPYTHWGGLLPFLISRRCVANLYAALKYGVYDWNVISTLLDDYGLNKEEQRLLVPCLYLVLLRSNDFQQFARLVRRPLTKRFARLICQYCGIECPSSVSRV